MSSRGRSILAGSALAGLLALAGRAVMPASAEALDPTAAATVSIGDGGAIWPTERGSARRDGRAPSLPATRSVRWSQRVAARLDSAPIVAADGAVPVIGTRSGSTGVETTLYELGPLDGHERAATRIDDTVAAPPILLASGVRVVITQRGDAIGVDPGGSIRFRTALGGDFSSVARVGLVPLPGGGFSVARRSDLIELGGDGAIVGRVRLEVSPAIAARADGDTVGVAPTGELWLWRAGRLPRSPGAFGDRAALGSGTQMCPSGPVLDGGGVGPGARRPRAICVLAGESVVEALDLQTGARTALLARPLLPFHTSVAVGLAGDVAVGTAGGTVTGLGPGGLEYGPIDLPGTLVFTGTSTGTGGSKDGGVLLPTTGEFPPLLADDGAVLYGASEGIAIARPGAATTTLTQCRGPFATTVAGVASAGPGAVVVACTEGRIELLGDGPPKSAKAKPAADAAP